MWTVTIDAELSNDGPALLHTELKHLRAALQAEMTAGDRSVAVVFPVEAADSEGAVRAGRDRFLAAARAGLEIVSVNAVEQL